MHEKIQRFSLRKLSVGLASVMVGACIFSVNGKTVKADVTSDQTTQTTNVQGQIATAQPQENKNLLDDLGKQKASTDNNQAEAQENRLVDQINYKLTNNTSTDNKENLGQNKVAPDETKQTSTIKSDAEKSIVGSSSTQKINNQSNDHAENNSQTQSQKLDITKISQQLNQKELATNLTETNNKTTHSYIKEGSNASTFKNPPKSLLASDKFDYSGTTTIQWNDKLTKGIPSGVFVTKNGQNQDIRYSNEDINGIVAIASTTLTGNNYIVDPNTNQKTRIAKLNRIFSDLKDTNEDVNQPRVISIYIDDWLGSNVSIYGKANSLSEYLEYFDDQGKKINIPLAYDIQTITSLDGDSAHPDTNNPESVKGINGSIVYPISNTEFVNNDPNTNAVEGTGQNGQALAIGGLTNGLTFYKSEGYWDQWTMGLATPSQMQSLPYSEIDTRGISRNIHFVDENGNQIQPTLTQTASWVSVKDKQGNIKTIGNQPNIAEYDIPHELTANGKTYLIDAFTDGNSTKLASWTPANTDKNQDVYLVYKDLDVSVKYVDAVSGQTVKNDSFVSDPSQSVTYNYSVPDGYVLEAPAKNSTSYTFGDDKSDTTTITINLRKAIKRHYRVIENLPDGTQKIILDFNLTLPQRKDGSYGIPDFDENGNSLGEDNADPKKYDTLNKYFGGIPKMSSSNNVHINPDIGSPTNDYSCVVFEPDLVNNTTLILDKAVSPQSFVFINDKTAQFMWTTSYSGITADQNPSRDFFINYQHNTQNVTDPSQLQTTGKRTITIKMPKGHGDQMTIVQTVGYKRTGTLDLYTSKTTYTDWVFDADTSNVTVNGQPSTQYQAYVLNNGVVSYAPIKLPHINGYKSKLIQDKTNPAMFLVSFMALPQQPSDNVQSPQKPAQTEQKQPEPVQNTPAPVESDKEVAQILNHIAFELMHNDSSDNADSFEPAQNDSDQLETASDSTQKDDAAKPQKVNAAKHKKHIAKKRVVKHHKKHAKKYHLKRRSRKHTKRAKKRIMKHRRTSKKFKKYSLKKHIKRV